MTDVTKRLADILADYTTAMNDVKRHNDLGRFQHRPRIWVLLPADMQRGCESPRCDDFGWPSWLR